MFKEIELSNAKCLLEAGCVILVTSGTMDRKNIMTFSWQTPINSINPCLVLLCIGKGHFTYELVKENPELVINIPGIGLLNTVHSVGSVSGREVDKFKKFSLTAALTSDNYFSRTGFLIVASHAPAEKVKPTIIAECGAYLECRISQFISIESHELLICEVIRAVADDTLFDGAWIPEKEGTLHFLGGNAYGVLCRKEMVTL